MNLQAIRDELANLRPDGFYGYGRTPGLPELPCVVAGMPRSVTYDNSPRPVVLVPVLVCVPGTDEDAEVAALDAAAALVERLRDAPIGSYYKGLRVSEIEEFGQITFGESLKCTGARVVVELRAWS